MLTAIALLAALAGDTITIGADDAALLEASRPSAPALLCVGAPQMHYGTRVWLAGLRLPARDEPRCGRLPVVVQAATCEPEAAVPFMDGRPFIVVQCGEDAFRIYWKPETWRQA